MALIEVIVPQQITISNNPIPICYGSTNSSETGFKMKIDIYEKVADEKLATLIIYPDVVNSYQCFYDFSRVLSDNLTSNLTDNWDTSSISPNNNSFIRWYYIITEYIGDTSGSTYTSNEYFTFRATLQYGTFWNYDDYYPQSGNTGTFLTNFPSFKTYRIDEYDTCNLLGGGYDLYPVFSGLTTNWDRVYYEIFDAHETGTIYYIENNNSTNLPRLLTIPVGPKNINDAVIAGRVYDSDDILVPTGTTLINNGVVNYEIDVRYSGYSSSNNSSNTLTVTIDNENYKYNGVQFVYLGELGSYETYTFRNKDQKEFNIKRSEYKKQLLHYYDVDDVETYSYIVGDRGDSVHHVSSKEFHKVYSDYIRDDEEDNKIMELYHSPEVYIIQNDNIYPIIVLDTNVKNYNTYNDKTWVREISFKMAYEKRINN